MSYPRQLSKGNNNVVVALNETEVAKIFGTDTRSDIGSEAEKMIFANQVNDLVVKFRRIESDEEPMLVMERLYPYDYRAYDIEQRNLFFEVFVQELTDLHKAGFIHRDIIRPSAAGGDPFDNVFLTRQGIRLIDVGISALRDNIGLKLFQLYRQKEQEEIEIFKRYFLQR